MATGNAACRNARPSSAGLKMFWPRPPKISLPNAIATTPPKNAIHNGKLGGNVRPSSNPVIMPDPSRSEPFDPKIRSARVAPTVADAVTSSAPRPKK